MQKLSKILTKFDLNFLGLFLIISLIILNLGVYLNLDLRFRYKLMPEIAMSDEIVVLEIGDKELNQIGSWPWERATLSNIISEIKESEPKALGIDIIFQNKNESESNNNLLINQLRAKNVIAARSDDISFQNINSELSRSVRTGIVHYPAASNGYVYSIQSLYQNNPILPLEMLRSETENLTAIDKFGLNTNTSLPTTISLVDYLNVPELKDKLTGKYVFLGASSKSLGDFVSVPGFDSIPGVYVHALVLNQYLNQSFPQIYNTDLSLLVLTTLFIGLLFGLSFFKNYTWWIWLEANLFFILVWLSPFRMRFSVVSLLSLTGAVFLTQIIKTIWRNLEDRQKFKNVLGAHLSPQVMSMTSENINKINLGGQKYNIAVLFTDLRGFTRYSEKVDPSEVGVTLNNILGFQADSILESDGVVDKFIGDSVMGFWGAPIKDPEYSLKALMTTAKIAVQFKKWKESGEYHFEIGLALHEGSAVVGNFGSKKRFNYTSIGDTVNTASRLESLTKFYGSTVLITSTLWNSLTKKQQQDYQVSLIDIIKPRGKQKQIAIYELQRYFDGKKWHEIQAQTSDNYDKIFEMYQKSEFAKAIKLCQKHKSNKTKIIMDRCKELMQNKNLNWDGVWVFE